MPGSKVRIFVRSSLYKIPEAVEAMTEGNLEMAWGQFGKTAQVDPYMSVVVGPMLLTTAGAINQLDEFETYKKLAAKLGTATADWIKSSTPGGADEWVDKFAMEAKAAVDKNPAGSNWLDETDCSAMEPIWAKYAKPKKT